MTTTTNWKTPAVDDVPKSAASAVIDVKLERLAEGETALDEALSSSAELAKEGGGGKGEEGQVGESA